MVDSEDSCCSLLNLKVSAVSLPFRCLNLILMMFRSRRPSPKAKTVSGHQVDQAFLFLASGFETFKVGRKLAPGRHDREHLGAQVDGVRVSPSGGVGSE